MTAPHKQILFLVVAILASQITGRIPNLSINQTPNNVTKLPVSCRVNL